jgi:hypothetical protein
MASYIASEGTDNLKKFINDSTRKNIHELDSILYKTESKLDDLMDLYQKPGLSEVEKKKIALEASYLENDVTKLNKSLAFLVSANTNDELANILFHDVKLSLESSKIAYEDDVAEREKNMNEASMDLSFLRPSNETNPQNSLAPEILQLISTIPKTELKFDENGEIAAHEKSVSELMPLLTYIHDYTDVFKEVQKVLNNTVAIDLKLTPADIAGAKKEKVKTKQAEALRKANLFDTMYDKLSDYAEESNSNIVYEVLSKLDKLIASKSEQDAEDIKSKFVKSFHKAKSNNVMHTANKSTLRFGPNAGSEMINVNKVDLSNENTRADALASEITVKSFLTLNSSKSDAKVKQMNNAYIALFSPKSFADESNNLKKYLESKYGMTLHEKTISQLISNINRGPNPSKNNTRVTDFLRSMDEMNSLKYRTSSIITKGKKKGKYTLSNLAKDYFKASSSDKEIILDNFVSNGGVSTEFKRIAELEYNNNPTSADSSIAVGSKKVWLYSFMSKMQKDILTWKAGDVSGLEDLKDTGNGMVDFLLGKDENGLYSKELSQKRIDGIDLKNNMELRKKMDTNPETFDSLSEEDLLLLTFTNLYENRKEKYVEREQGGSEMVGENVLLREMLDARETANEFTFLNNSDKTQTLSFSGVLRGDSDVSTKDDGTITSIGAKNIQRIKGLFEGELKKIAKARETIIKYEAMPSDTDKQKAAKLSFSLRNLIPGWHYDAKGIDYTNPNEIISSEAFLKGNYRRFGFLNGFYNANFDKINNRYFLDNKAKDPFYARKALDNVGFDIDEAIDDYFTEILQVETKELTDMTGASERVEYGEYGPETVSRKGLFEIQTSVIHEGVEIDQHKTASDFLMNYMFHSIDLFNIMNGEIGMYKQSGTEFNMLDALKRTSAVNADGIYANNPDPLEIAEYIPYGNHSPVKYFKNTKTIFAVIKAQKYDQSHYGEIINNLIKENNKNNHITLSGEVSDGASYGHPEFLFDFYKRSYGMSKEDEKLHKELMNEKTIPTDKHFKFLKSLGGSNQPGKLQAFSIIKKEDGTRMPFFWKSSVLPLYPSLTKGFEIDKLRAQMVKQNIGVVGNDSAFKSTTHGSTKLYEESNDDNTLGNIVDNIDLNPFEVSTGDIKIQVELSAKGDKEDTVAGSQPLRNITANMDLESGEKVYTYKEEALTGKEMKLRYDNNIKEIVQFQLDSFLRKIEYSGDGSFDESIFRKMITNQLTDLDFDLKDILEDTSMPLETIPGMSNRVYPILTSYIDKNVSKPKTNGTASIQVPAAGFNHLTADQKSGSILFNKNNQLKPPRPTAFVDYQERVLKEEGGQEKIDYLLNFIEEYNAERSEEDKFDLETSPLYFSSENPDMIQLSKQPGFFAQIEDGEIMIPFSSLFKNSKMTWEEFQAFATKRDELGNLIGIDQQILENLVGYRIPNQSMSSNDSFKVVGILHPSAGDVAIMYHEITAKTGSDFDIDKMVLMLPNFNTIYEKQDESKLSKSNRNAIDESLRNNPVNNFMTTDKYTSVNQIYSVLFRNEKLKEFADEERFYDQTDEDRLEFFTENRGDIEFYLNRDNRKANNKPGFEFSIKETLEDLYNAIDSRNNNVDKELAEKGFGPRNRFIASEFNYISDNSEKGLQNNLIESMRSILKSSKTFDDLISPLDGSHIKDSINEVRYEYFLSQGGGKPSVDNFRKMSESEKTKAVKEYIKSQEKSLVASMMPKFLAGSRTDMLMAKGLTATMANHMTNIPLTQASKIFLKYNIGLGATSLARTHIIGKEDYDDFKITKMVSYLMNASVDAAKDNYIIQGNYNRYTSGAAMLFVRLGIDPKEAAKILQHPILVKLSKEKLGSKSKIASISASYTNIQLDELAIKIADKINNGTKIDPEAFMANIYEANTTMQEKDKIGLSDEDILGFWHLAVSIGKDLNEAIQLSKPDSFGAGSTLSEFHSISNLHDKADGNALASITDEKEQIGGGMTFNERTTGIHPFNPQLTTESDQNSEYVSGLKGNYVASISDASVSLVDALTREKLIERTPGYTELLNKIMINLGLGHSIKEDKIKKLSSMLYPYVLSTSGNEIYNFVQDKESGIDDIKDMLDILPKDILKLKADENYLDNAFLKEISVDEAKGFISFNNVANYSNLSKIAIKDAANSLYSDNKTRELIERMVKYSFFTTGFRPSSYSFANYMPKQYFVDSKHNESINELLMKLNNKDAYVAANLEGAMMFLASNRPEDETINKKLKGGNISIKSGTAVNNESLVKRLLYTDPDTKEKHFYPFVSVSKKNIVTNYALVDIIKAKKDGQLDQPVYESINVMQYKSDSKFNQQEETDTDTDYDGEIDYSGDETGPVDFSIGEKRGIDKKNRNSRLLLFDTNLATPEFLFKNNKNARIQLRMTNDNVYAYRNQVLFGLNKSNESLRGEKDREMYLDGLTKSMAVKDKSMEIKDMKSNDDVYDSLLNTVSLTSEEIKEYENIIDHFYKQDKDASSKQKATNELDKLKGCS